MSETTASGPVAAQIRIGSKLYPAAATQEILAALAAENKRHAIAGLPDELNPRLVDPAKATALLAALTPERLAPLSKRALALGPGALRIGTSAPTTPASFARPFTLAIESEHDSGKTATARANVAVDCTLARERAATARRRVAQSQREVATLTASKEAARNTPQEAPTTSALYDATQLRFAVAMAWVENAEAASQCAPQDAAAKADLVEALRVRSASAVPGGSMQ